MNGLHTKLGLLIAAIGCGDNRTEDGDAPRARYQLRIENIAPWTVLSAGTRGNAPLGPGETLDVTIRGGKGHAINFATMLGESNDWFFAPDGAGIPLFDASGNPRAGDVTGYVKLWNAGTELDQEPAIGDATAPRQPTPNTGARDPDDRVREITGSVVLADGRTFVVPGVGEMIRATLIPGTDRTFILRIENVSTPSTLGTSQGSMPVHLSPLAWTVHQLRDPLFSSGQRRAGLESLAEDGMPDQVGAALVADAGFATPLSPGVVTLGAALYALDTPDYGEGLEQLAEDGSPERLHESRADTLVFDTPVGQTVPGPAMPGAAFEVAIDAAPTERLHFASMFGMSNDWIFTTPPAGILLAEGDFTDQLLLVDVGTEIDQEPAIGEFTAPQQPAPNVGPADPDPNVREAAYDRSVAEHLVLSARRLQIIR